MRLSAQCFHLPRAGGRPRVARPVRAAVVGGGIAGLASATVLTERGADVTLFESERFLGGRAGSWTEELDGGRRLQVERGFHGFFRQYYNLRALLRRVDPGLERLRPLEDYPIFGPGGRVQSFRGLPAHPPCNLVALTQRTPYLSLRDLRRIDVGAALAMVAFDPEMTYARYDWLDAGTYLDSLRFPEEGRRMLFDVFAHSFFNPEREMSAAELIMMFHFYFTGNPEGLLFDVARQPHSTAFWEPLGRYLEGRGASIRRGVGARSVGRGRERRFRLEHDAGTEEFDLLVLALSVPGLSSLVAHSPDLDDGSLRAQVQELSVTRPFAVWRLWLDRPLRPERPPFAGTTAVGPLDNISLFHLFEDESAAFARESGGSVVELHAYAVPRGVGEASLRRDLLAGLHALYPETIGARVLCDRFLLRRDCPSFAPGSHRGRPEVDTGVPGLALAGDFIRLPIPSALMERAASSGMLAANTLLAPYGVAPEPIHSVAPRGLFAPIERLWRGRA